MKSNLLLISVISVIISFVGGFFLANALNRNELNSLAAENERLENSRNSSQTNDSQDTLTNDEIRRKIAQADEIPDNFGFQKNLGLALYRYAAMKQDAELLAEVIRLLSRANELDKKDYDVIVALGNSFFDIGFYKKNNQDFQKAREFYQAALDAKPDDADVRTDLGLTYFLTEPPQMDLAIEEFHKSLQTNPRHEKTLQVLTQAHLSQNKIQEAEIYLEKLKAVNQNNKFLPELSAQLAKSKNESQTQ